VRQSGAFVSVCGPVFNGSSSGLVYRHCFAPQTVPLMVVKNPAKISDGADLLWVKSGKYAKAP
jgi:hypothetical protein